MNPLKFASPKAVWAVDAMSADRHLQTSTLRALATLTKPLNCPIQPVCVISPDQLKVPVHAFEVKSGEMRLELENILGSWLRSLEEPRLTSPTLLIHSVFSEEESVDVLLEYARESGASLIGVGTHNRTGLKRWLVGSFAETLILTSEIPVLIVNPLTESSRMMDKILFPTDFSEASDRAFQTLLSTITGSDTQVFVYHKIDYVLPLTVSTLTSVPEYGAYFAMDARVRRDNLESYATKARGEGVRAETILDEEPGYIEAGIVKAADRVGARLVALASQSGRFGSMLLGSKARHLMRTLTVPLWVIHPTPHVTEEEKREPLGWEMGGVAMGQ